VTTPTTAENPTLHYAIAGVITGDPHDAFGGVVGDNTNNGFKQKTKVN
jgi:hypothetical protein